MSGMFLSPVRKNKQTLFNTPNIENWGKGVRATNKFPLVEQSFDKNFVSECRWQMVVVAVRVLGELWNWRVKTKMEIENLKIFEIQQNVILKFLLSNFEDWRS